MSDMATAVLAASLLILLTTLYVLLRRRSINSGKAKRDTLNTPHVRLLIGTALILVLATIALFAVAALTELREQTRKQAGESLRAVSFTTNAALSSWMSGWESRTSSLAGEPALRTQIVGLLRKQPTSKILERSREQRRIREIIRDHESNLEHTGFFIISPDYVNLGSSRNSNLAQVNLIAEEYPWLLERAFQGETVLVPSIRSDVPLEGVTGTTDFHASIFIVAPVHSKIGEVLAVIAMRMDPAIELGRLTSGGQLGTSGETYFSNDQGLMISPSRFREELLDSGTLLPGQTAILNVELRPPAEPAKANTAPPADAGGFTVSAAAINEHRSGENVLGYKSYRGAEVIGAWRWNEALGIGLITEIDLAETMKGYQGSRNIILGLMGATVPLCLFLGAVVFWISRRSNAQLRKANEGLEHRVQQRTEDLETRESRLWDLYENAPVAYVSITSDGAILKHNRAFSELTGYRREEFEDINWQDLLTAGNAEIAQRITGGEPCMDVQLAIQRKDGSAVFTSVSAVPMFSEDTLEEVRVSLLDFTERAEAMRLLEGAKQLAEDANQTKSDFLANMSHEIRTPMNAIIGMSYLALQTELSSKQRNYIEKVNRSAEALLGIINDILDFSKIEAGKLRLENIEFRLEDVLINLSNLVGLKAEEAGLELLFDIAPNIPTCLVGDPLRLGQILINLGNNAVKFTETGDVVLKIRLLEDRGNRVCLQFDVSDTGIGMSEEQQTRLFQPFSQADTSTTRTYGGTGLGLAICQNMTRMMGGEIWVTSEPAVGSVFSFTAHFGLQDEGVVPEKYDLTELQSLRALVVDDNKHARDIMFEMMSSFGVQTQVAAGGADAILLLENAPESEEISLVIMDWQMPGMDGIEATRVLQASPRIQHLPIVIMLTAHGKEELVAHTDSIAVNAILTKPVTPSTLLETVISILGNGNALSASAGAHDEMFSEAVEILSGARILLVEDNELNQELAMEILESNGIQVTIANNGQEAIDIMQEQIFDGLLMDCQMPVLDGYSATRQLRLDDRFTRLPILAMTANAMAGDREKALAAGMNDHIPKPINVSQMFQTMAKWIQPAERAATQRSDFAGDNASVTLPELAGVDMEASLDRLRGNKALYLKLLQRFYEKYQDFDAQLSTATAAVETEPATRMAHTIKGLAGNLGATALESVAAQAEREFATGDLAVETLATLREELAALLSQIEPAMAAQDEQPVSSSFEPEQARELLEQLSAMLTDFDAQAGTFLDEHKSALASNPMAADLQRLGRAIDDYDYERSAQLVGDMIQKLD